MYFRCTWTLIGLESYSSSVETNDRDKSLENPVKEVEVSKELHTTVANKRQPGGGMQSNQTITQNRFEVLHDEVDSHSSNKIVIGDYNVKYAKSTQQKQRV